MTKKAVDRTKLFSKNNSKEFKNAVIGIWKSKASTLNKKLKQRTAKEK